MKGLSLVVFLITVSLGIAVFLATSKKTVFPILKKPSESPLKTETPRDPSLKKLQVGDTFVWVKICQTDEEKRQGLSGVKSMAEDEGMLFVYNTAAAYKFWMKDMNFSLDFIWIREGEVVDLSENVPVFDEDGEITRVRPGRLVDQILEVNSGFIEKNNIGVGDKVSLIEN